MLNLLMPDAKIVSGVNVQQAAASPFGLYVLSVLAPQDQQIQQLASLIGFDPRRDVTEVLMGAPGPSGLGKQAGLVVARGNFAISTLLATAQQKGATTESYKGITILEDPKPNTRRGFPGCRYVIGNRDAGCPGTGGPSEGRD